MAELFCLYSSKDGLPRFIGRTDETSESESKRLIAAALDGDKSVLSEWIVEVLRSGFIVDSYILQRDAAPDELETFERHWVNQFPGVLNKPHGKSRPTKKSALSQQIIAAIKAKLEAEKARHRG